MHGVGWLRIDEGSPGGALYISVHPITTVVAQSCHALLCPERPYFSLLDGVFVILIGQEL